MRFLQSPCSFGGVRQICPKTCKFCQCPPPEPSDWRATSLTCTQGAGNNGVYGDTCELTCPDAHSSLGKLECVDGAWQGTEGDPSCMSDCGNTGLTLPEKGVALNSASFPWRGCEALRHRERCKLTCEEGTTASALWECYDGTPRSTREGIEPQCLRDCGPPPLPDLALQFKSCRNPVLEAMEADQPEFDGPAVLGAAAAQVADIPADVGANVSAMANATNISNVSIPAWALDVCQLALAQQGGGRRLEAAAAAKGRLSSLWLRRLQANATGNVSALIDQDTLQEAEDFLISGATNGSGNDSAIFVPRTTPSGSSCGLSCRSPFTASAEYTCWDGEWTVPKCEIILERTDWRWPQHGGSIISPLGGVYLNYNLDVVLPNRSQADGKQITICGTDGLGCPPTDDCFASVPVDDDSRMTTDDSHLSVRLGHGSDDLQTYGCEYEISVPAGAVLAVADRTVGNKGSTWRYKLIPPPPRLVILEVSARYSDVIVKVMYNEQCTIRCMAKPVGEKPSQLEIEMLMKFVVQSIADVPTTTIVGDLEEMTEYNLFCRATGLRGKSDSIYSVYDNAVRFTTKSRIPYIVSLEVENVWNTEALITVQYSSQSKIRCKGVARSEQLLIGQATTTISWASHLDKCLKGSPDGAVELQPCSSEGGDMSFLLAEGGVGKIRSGASDDVCLAVRKQSGVHANGDVVQMRPCDDNENLYTMSFTMEANVTGLIRIGSSDKCIDVIGGKTYNGAQLQAWDCSETNVNQHFVAADVSSVLAAEAVDFWEEPKDIKVTGLLPGRPTTIICVAQVEDTTGNGGVYWQRVENSMKHQLHVDTPPMTLTDLASLSAEGCELVPAFQPNLKVYGCALPVGGAESATVKLRASVSAEDYSSLLCAEGGTAASECASTLTVQQNQPALWRLVVRAQSGKEEPVLVSAARETTIVPKEIRPLQLPAETAVPEMTICAAGKEDALPSDISEVSGVLLPGSWNMIIKSMHTGDSLPTCSCSACNLEVVVSVRGAGANLIPVLFVRGTPMFSIDDSLKVSFKKPEVADVDPPAFSMYTPTPIKVFGRHLGHLQDVGATIFVEKSGEVPAIPPRAIYRGCPLLWLAFNFTQLEETWKTWAAPEFTGKYLYSAETGEYTMSRETTIALTQQQMLELPGSMQGDVDESDISGPLRPGQLKDDIMEVIGMCCYTDLRVDNILTNTSEGGRVIFSRHGRNMPRMRQRGRAWSIESREVPDLRVERSDEDLSSTEGWVLRYKSSAPGPGKFPERAWGRRLEDTGKDKNGEMKAMLLEIEDGMRGFLASFPGGQTAARKPRRAPLEHTQDRQLQSATEGTEEKKCKDDTPRMKKFLKNAEIEVPGVVGWLLSCRSAVGAMPELCTGLQYICECSCESFNPRPKESPVDIEWECQRCGDGIVVAEEECDDGNLREGDGCSYICQAEEGWSCASGQCARLAGSNPDDKNLCGPTTWLDDRTLTCVMKADAVSPIALRVEVAGQVSNLADWIEYMRPSITFLVAADPDLDEAGRRLQGVMPRVLEFTGRQELSLGGRGLPPTGGNGPKHKVVMILDKTVLLCIDIEITSSSELKCYTTQPFSLDDVSADPELSVRVEEVSSPGIKLSTLGMPLRKPEILNVTPALFNDTDTKELEFATNHTGTPASGTLHITIGGTPCVVRSHTQHHVRCALGYVPKGSWRVVMMLGNVASDSNVTVQVEPTLCNIGRKRVAVETSECAFCEAGTAEPEVNADFSCPTCESPLFQNYTGTAACRSCTPNAFSVLPRHEEETCRCKAGHFHAYGDTSLAARCSKCEAERGFGWSTSNWTQNCETCLDPYPGPETVSDVGNCSKECYGYQCSKCPFGTVCFGNAAWPRVLPGFYAEDVYKEDAGTVERCMPMEACLGDDGAGNMVCSTGYGGLRCGVCLFGYYKDQHRCEMCPKNQWIFGALFFAFFCFVVVFGVIPAQILFMLRLIGVQTRLPWIWRMACIIPQACVRRFCTRKTSLVEPPEARQEPREQPPPMPSSVVSRTVERVKRWDAELREAPLLRTLAMCLNFGQTCYAFSMLQRPQVRWPGPSWELLSWTKLLTVDVEFMKPDCVVPLPFFTKWIGKFCFPFGLIAMLFVVTLYLDWHLRRTQANWSRQNAGKLWNAFGFTLALAIHVSLIWHLKVTLSPVDCNWCREGVTCLDEYTLVECWSDDPTWTKMIVISVVDFVFISGAFPIFLSCAIWHCWRTREVRALATEEKPGIDVSSSPTRKPKTAFEEAVSTRLWSFVSFFVTGYKGRQDGGVLVTYAWELVVLLRKVASIQGIAVEQHRRLAQYPRVHHSAVSLSADHGRRRGLQRVLRGRQRRRFVRRCCHGHGCRFPQALVRLRGRAAAAGPAVVQGRSRSRSRSGCPTAEELRSRQAPRGGTTCGQGSRRRRRLQPSTDCCRLRNQADGDACHTTGQCRRGPADVDSCCLCGWRSDSVRFDDGGAVLSHSAKLGISSLDVNM
eukprot:TRINITY_DN33882_c0_g2_i2.p1 TRINITY_DN33882_c0_g2~~TRINITY_DN33882_c0_g2_i2.p1  ORF type:complete len:2643 (-),score=477.19 TRINITY_DN33882_c0_g2_i2:80-7504(-)